MSIVKCSSCDHPEIYFKLKVPGECKTHLYCSKCFKENPIEGISKFSECPKCMEFYKSELIPKSSYCKYCNKHLTFETVCIKHSVCGNCLFAWPVKNVKNCFGCLRTRSHVCSFCMNYSLKKTLKCPTHFEHRYCSKCYKSFKNEYQKLSCELCKITFRPATQENICLICKEDFEDLYIKECNNYKLCITCLNILSSSKFSELYPEITSSEDFIRKFEIDIKNKCLSCWRPLNKNCVNIDCKLVMLSCKDEHIFCLTCFRMPRTKKNKISCEYCNEYFLSPNSTCYFCRKPRENYESIECGHIICHYCLFFIKDNNSIRYIKNINCMNCKDYLCLTYGIEKRILDTGENIINAFRNNKIKNSEDELIINLCKQCSTELDSPNCRIRNIKCPYNHCYCINCFGGNLNKKHFECNNCKMLCKPGLDYNCIFCKDSIKSKYIQLCSNHSICKTCRDILSDYEFECYTKAFGCCNCIKKFKNQNAITRKNKSPQNMISIQDSQESYTQNSEKSNKPILESSCSLSNKKHKTENFSTNTESFKKQEKKNPPHSIGNFEDIKLNSLVEASKHANARKTNSQKTEPSDKLCSVIGIENKKNSLETLLNKTEVTVANIIYTVPGNIKAPIKKDDFVINPNSESESKLNSSEKQQVSGKNKEADLENLYKLNAKTEKNFTFCCGNQVGRMECSHPLCMKCIENAFEIKFNYFITLLVARNYDLLNSTSWGIGCYKNECYLKVCFQYELVKDIALKIVKTCNFPEKLAHHFDLLFEGIKYNFHECEKCRFVTGDKPGGACMWCN